jgi:N-acetyl-alpha-D-muramate 1-phosphate uridylyltransferase
MPMNPLIDFPVMILAAGRGERMRPLTDHLPKPMLEIHGKSLLQHHLENLKNYGFKKVVINHAWLGHKIEEALGDGSNMGLEIHYSPEEKALETAGGIRNALEILNASDYFLVINGDTFMPGFPFNRVQEVIEQLRIDIAEGSKPLLAYLFLTKNPSHHPQGDFYLVSPHIFSDEQLSSNPLGHGKYTFSGAGIYHHDLFKDIPKGEKAALAPILKNAMGSLLVEGELMTSPWHDVGTPDRLLALNQTNKFL